MSAVVETFLEEEDDEEGDYSALRTKHDTYYRSALRDLIMSQTMRSSQAKELKPTIIGTVDDYQHLNWGSTDRRVDTF